jgi:hypothetical protein
MRLASLLWPEWRFRYNYGFADLVNLYGFSFKIAAQQKLKKDGGPSSPGGKAKAPIITIIGV